MTGKWVRELEEAISNARAAIVRTSADMDALYAGYARGGRTVFAVMSKENALDGYMRRPAARWDARRQGFTCPDCGSVIQMEFMDCGKRTLTDATPEYFRTETRANRKCEGCGAVLWTATTAEEQSEWVRISHLGYVHRRFAYLARDACKTAAAKKQLAALLREPDRLDSHHRGGTERMGAHQPSGLCPPPFCVPCAGRLQNSGGEKAACRPAARAGPFHGRPRRVPPLPAQHLYQKPVQREDRRPDSG